MRILLLAPNPFFQERGTPLAIKLLLEALAEQGHKIDVLTYHEGETPEIPNVRIFRIPRLPLVSNVPIGFSWKKLVCDAFLGTALAWRLMRERYDVIHAVEESVYLAWAAKALIGVPFLYDMDSSLAAQIVERLPGAASLGPFLTYLENSAIRQASAVTAMCEALATTARGCVRPGVPVHVIEDVAMGDPATGVPSLKREFSIEDPMFLYVGNLEAYQGIDLMLHAFGDIVARGLPGHLVVVGGNADHIASYTTKATELALNDRVHWTGPRPIEQLPGLLTQADILLSPRVAGVNTPMKIYSYLAAGVPIVATRIQSHTQVLNEEVSVLTEACPSAYADGIASLLDDPATAHATGQRARELSNRCYSREAFASKVARLYGAVAQRLPRAG